MIVLKIPKGKNRVIARKHAIQESKKSIYMSKVRTYCNPLEVSLYGK